MLVKKKRRKKKEKRQQLYQKPKVLAVIDPRMIHIVSLFCHLGLKLGEMSGLLCVQHLQLTFTESLMFIVCRFVVVAWIFCLL